MQNRRLTSRRSSSSIRRRHRALSQAVCASFEPLEARQLLTANPGDTQRWALRGGMLAC